MLKINTQMPIGPDSLWVWVSPSCYCNLKTFVGRWYVFDSDSEYNNTFKQLTLF